MKLLVTNFLILKTKDGIRTYNYMCRQVLTYAFNFSFEITPNSQVVFKFEIFTLFLHLALMSIFVANNAS